MRRLALSVATTMAIAAAGEPWAGVGAAQSAPGRPAETLSLEQAVALALDHSPSALSARGAVDQASLSVRAAHSAFSLKVLPSVLGSIGQTSLGNQTYGVNLSQKFASGTEIRGNVGATSFQNQLGNYFNSDTTFQITQPMLRGFGSAVTTRPLVDAEWRVADAGRQLELTEQQVALEVAGAYYAVVVQTHLAGVAETALARAGDLRDASTARLATGRVSLLDVLRAEQLVAQAEFQLLGARSALADAEDRLRMLVGWPSDRAVLVEETISVEIQPIAPAEAVSVALGHRVEVRAASELVAQSDREVAAARNQLRPQVDLGVALTRQEAASDLSSAFGLDRFRVATFAGVSMPLDRTVEQVSLQNALIERARRQRDVTFARDRVTLEARQSVRRQESAVKALALARSSVELAQREVEIATLRFQRGLSNNLDVVSAQVTLRGAQSQEIAARAEVALGRLGLRAATGVLNPRQDVK